MHLPLLKNSLPFLYAFLVLLALPSCVATSPSSYQYSREVEQLFETPTLVEQHTYYFLGSETEPDAVIAIDNQFNMTSKVWSKVDITQKQLDDWAFQFSTYPGWYRCPYKGVILFAADGNRVGIGFSKWTFNAVKNVSPEEIIVYPPFAMGSCKGQQFFDDM